jgi:hypothetical protein
MSDSYDARRLTILFRSTDHVHHHSLATEVLSRARKARLAGATLLQGSSDGRSRRGLLIEDVPLEIVIVDEPEKIDSFLSENRQLLEGLVMLLADVRASRS